VKIKNLTFGPCRKNLEKFIIIRLATVFCTITNSCQNPDKFYESLPWVGDGAKKRWRMSKCVQLASSTRTFSHTHTHTRL